MHIQLERSSLLSGNDWSSFRREWFTSPLKLTTSWWISLWPLLFGLAVVILACNLYRRLLLPARVPSILRQKVSPIVDKVSTESTAGTGAAATRQSFFGLFTFDNLPISLSIVPPPQSSRQNHVGIGLRAASQQQPTKPTATSLGLAHLVRGPSAMPAQPQHQPVSMAKIIMSRHTFRKPSVALARTAPLRRPPPESILPPPPSQPQQHLPPSRSPSPEAAERGEGSPSSSDDERDDDDEKTQRKPSSPV